MSVDAYNSFLCKNPALCFINFEQAILFFIPVQFGILHSNPILNSSSDLGIFSYL